MEPWAVQSGAGITLSQGITPEFYLPHLNVGTLVLLLLLPLCTTLSPSLSTGLHISASPTRLDECGFFKALVVGLQYSLIF